MAEWHAHVTHTPKHMSMVGPLWWEALNPDLFPPIKSRSIRTEASGERIWTLLPNTVEYPQHLISGKFYEPQL